MKRVKPLLKRLHELNPELTTKCLYKYVDIGDGMEIKLDQYLHTRKNKAYDSVEFSFKLEGRYIGGVDQGLGGSISHPENESCVDDDFKLMDACTDRIEELWSGIEETVERHWCEVQEVEYKPKIKIDVKLIPPELRNLVK
jgi:hypothetical protein